MSLSLTAGQEIDDHMHNQIQLKLIRTLVNSSTDNTETTEEDVRHMQSLEQKHCSSAMDVKTIAVIRGAAVEEETSKWDKRIKTELFIFCAM